MAASGRARLIGASLTAVGAVSFAIAITTAALYYKGGGAVESVLVARYAIVLAISLGMVLAGGATLALPRPELIAALGSGIVFGAGGLCAIGAYALIPVSLGVLIFYVFPLLTVVMEAPLDRRWPPLHQVLCLLAALAGIALALELGVVAADPVGIAMSALGALGVALSFVWSSRRLTAAHPATVNVFRSAAALALSLGFAAGVGNGLFASVGLSASVALAVSVGFSVLAFMTMFAGVERIGATPAAMIMNLEPVAGSCLALLLLGETLTPLKAAGGTLVVGAVLVSQLLGLRAERKASERLVVSEPLRMPPARQRAPGRQRVAGERLEASRGPVPAGGGR